MYFRKLFTETVKTINHPNDEASQWHMDKSLIVIQHSMLEKALNE